MDIQKIHRGLIKLQANFAGDIYIDETMRTLYATDASAYEELPIAVTRPKNNDDIKLLILFAKENQASIIPRTAGTSLAGQVVGGGIIADVSKYMTSIIELNKEEHWIRLQPGVVTDELNKYIEPHGLFFGPETSTSNRCMIGGMVGNNSCGAHSLIYGSTRDHTLEIKAILSDGSDVVFQAVSKFEFEQKCNGDSLENKLYQKVKIILDEPANQKEIREQYPEPSLKRRNTGYALDLLLETAQFSKTKEPFNFCKLIAGSEGTLAFITEIKLNLIPLPPKIKGLLCVHFNTLRDAFLGNLVALNHNPGAIEIMDDIIINCTKGNTEQTKNRFFIKGNPKAVLMIEFARDTEEEIVDIAQSLEADLNVSKLGYHFPLIFGADVKKAWNLRKAGLGLLANVIGDRKPVTVVEDTAVNPETFPDYMEEFQKMLKQYKLRCVYYGHIATGEIHLKPELNLKDPKDVALFRTIALETAKLVKKYKGSLSGEHGDGRLRGEFIPLMLGEKIYQLLKEIKQTFDAENIFNPGKIIGTPAMNTSLRLSVGKGTKNIKTYFDFSNKKGIIRAVESCTGSADCRKSEIIGGIMCPSFMATKNENATTRARANILREFLTHSLRSNPFDHKEIYDVMDLCLSCKGCKSECPSSVDMAKLKAEFLQHYYDANGVPRRAKMIGNIASINKFGANFSTITNFFLSNVFFSGLIKQYLGFSEKRTIPLLHNTTLIKWWKNNKSECIKQLKKQSKTNGKIFLFADEFTNFNDVEVGIKTIQLLTRLGYEVEIPFHVESGRTFLSKGLVKKAKIIATDNIGYLHHLITEETPLIGIEPSAILTFRDEYPDLTEGAVRESALVLAKNVFLIDEFLEKEIAKGKILQNQFTKEPKTIKLHGHCHQKSLASTAPMVKMLSLPKNYVVEEINSGCCGMAGSFGYEKEHYDVSMKIGELILFPEIRKSAENIIIAAPGTSCRHQIKDGTGRIAKHPVEILFEALV